MNPRGKGGVELHAVMQIDNWCPICGERLIENGILTTEYICIKDKKVFEIGLIEITKIDRKKLNEFIKKHKV